MWGTRRVTQGFRQVTWQAAAVISPSKVWSDYANGAGAGAERGHERAVSIDVAGYCGRSVPNYGKCRPTENASSIRVGWLLDRDISMSVMSSVVVAIVCLPAFLTFVWFSEVLAGCLALRNDRVAKGDVLGAPSHPRPY